MRGALDLLTPMRAVLPWYGWLALATAGAAALGLLTSRLAQRAGPSASVLAAGTLILATGAILAVTMAPLSPGDTDGAFALLSLDAAFKDSAGGFTLRLVGENVALFVPFGAAFTSLLRARRPLPALKVGAVALGAACALSVCVETYQYVRGLGRLASGFDVLTNSIGGGWGAVVAMVSARGAGPGGRRAGASVAGSRTGTGHGGGEAA